MKKLFSILVLAIVIFATPVKAQDIGNPIPVTMKNTWGQYEPSGTPSIAVDSIRTFYLYTGPIHGLKDVVTIQALAQKTSGTMTGSATLEVSSDGVVWSDYLGSRDTTGSKAVTYKWTLADNSTPQSYRWNLYNWGDHYARIKLVTTAVSVSTVTANYSAYLRRTH